MRVYKGVACHYCYIWSFLHSTALKAMLTSSSLSSSAPEQSTLPSRSRQEAANASVCELEDAVRLYMSKTGTDHVWRCGCSLHFVLKWEAAHASAASIRQRRGRQGAMQFNQNLELNQQLQKWLWMQQPLYRQNSGSIQTSPPPLPPPPPQELVSTKTTLLFQSELQSNKNKKDQFFTVQCQLCLLCRTV